MIIIINLSFFFLSPKIHLHFRCFILHTDEFTNNTMKEFCIWQARGPGFDSQVPWISCDCNFFTTLPSILPFFGRERFFLHLPHYNSRQVRVINPNLPNPMNFVSFGMMRYSIFDINRMSIASI